MENHVEVIQSAMAPDATDEARRAGADACRAVLALLEPTATSTEASEARTDAEASQADAPPQERPPSPPGPSVEQVLGAAVAAFKSMPRDKFLETAIEFVRSQLPPGTLEAARSAAPASVPTLQPLRFQLVPLPHLGGKK